jgi:hypothetical protein
MEITVNEPFFEKQNTFLKTFIIFIGIVISASVDFYNLLIIFIFTLFYVIISPCIYFRWLKTILILLPFYISFFIFGIIFNIPFNQHSYVAVKITYIILLSVYLVSTTSIEAFLTDSATLSKNIYTNKFRFFLVATIYFIPILIEQFETVKKKHKNIFNVIHQAVSQSMDEIKRVEMEALKKLENSSIRRKLAILPNHYMLLLLLLYFMVFIVK